MMKSTYYISVEKFLNNFINYFQYKIFIHEQAKSNGK